MHNSSLEMNGIGQPVGELGGKTKVDWLVTSWLIICHFLAFGGVFYFSWSALILCIIMYFVTGCFGITLGYHRLLSHRSMKANRWLERVLTLCGTLALQGTARDWVAHHRMHHAGSDTEEDPHNSKRGFWYSHIGWLFVWSKKFDDPQKLAKYARDIERDPWLKFMSSPQFMVIVQVLLGILFGVIGGAAWVFWGMFVRLVIVYHVTWLVNSATHQFGYQTYKTGEGSRNCWWVALVSFGEGWHNNHHHFGDVCRAGIKWWEFDITYMFIRILEKAGLIWGIKNPPIESTLLKSFRLVK